MATTSVPDNTPKRVVIRAHEHWHDEHEIIFQDSFHSAGYSKTAEFYDWTTNHYVHRGGGVNGGQFHFVNDMEKNNLNGSC